MGTFAEGLVIAASAVALLYNSIQLAEYLAAVFERVELPEFGFAAFQKK